MQRQRSFKFNHYDFELPDVELSEIADLKPHHFVKLFLDAQCTLDQEPEFYDRGMMTTAYLHLLRDAGNSNSLPNGTSFLNIVQRVSISSPLSMCGYIYSAVNRSGKMISTGTKNISPL